MLRLRVSCGQEKELVVVPGETPLAKLYAIVKGRLKLGSVPQPMSLHTVDGYRIEENELLLVRDALHDNDLVCVCIAGAQESEVWTTQPSTALSSQPPSSPFPFAAQTSLSSSPDLPSPGSMSKSMASLSLR